MSWHLNITHGYYSTRVPIGIVQYPNEFGVKDGGRQVILGPINFDLVEFEGNGLISIERRAYYRIKIWYERPSFYVSTFRDNPIRHYLDFIYP